MAQSVKSLPYNLEHLSLIPNTYIKSWSQRAREWLETTGLGVGTRDLVPCRGCQTGKTHRDVSYRSPGPLVGGVRREFREGLGKKRCRLRLGDARLMRRKGGLIC